MHNTHHRHKTIGLIYVHYDRYLKEGETPEDVRQEIVKAITKICNEHKCNSTIEGGIIR